ncbi:MAG: hypothetical protein M1814_005231 [Vezdaea aestivalis]|nr:MAG: hypothetical protein M1814_005231 [Vezdaea aestivalis]
MSTQTLPQPSSILLLGNGVFSLSTLYHLLSNPSYASASITLLAPSFPHPSSASQDHSRIVRSDYARPAYSRLAARAHCQWRSTHWGHEGRYSEAGLVLTASNQNGYVEGSLENVKTMAGAGSVQVCNSPAELRDVAGLPSAQLSDGVEADEELGKWGYVNRTAGWADASKSMAYLYSLIVKGKHANLTIIDDSATHLLTDTSGPTLTITGAQTKSHGPIYAELTIVATGSWTPSLIDMSGRAECSLQPIVYVRLEDTEAQALENVRTVLNMDTGTFLMPPKIFSEAEGGGTWLKAAKHCKGWRWEADVAAEQRVKIPEADNSSSMPVKAESLIKISVLPAPPSGKVYPPAPASAISSLLSFLTSLIQPSTPLSNRPLKSRLCPYLDTPTGDFLVAYPPRTEGLFVACGDSGHGFKFLPVLGEEIAGVLERKQVRVGEDDWANIWRWRDKVPVWRGTEDGSRGAEGGVLNSGWEGAI